MKRSSHAIGLLALGALLAAATAHAQYRSFITEDAGPYWRIDVGATIPLDGHVTEFDGLNSGQKVKYNVGGGLDVAAGYAFNKYVAAELQLGGTWNSVDSVEGASLQDSYFETAPILANVVFQYPIPRTLVTPYLGAGAGGAATLFDTDGLYVRAPGGGVTLYGSNADFVFAWQAFAGVRIALNDKMSLGVGYRFLAIDPSVFTYDSAYPGDPSLDLGLSSYQAHVVTVTFLMKF